MRLRAAIILERHGRFVEVIATIGRDIVGHVLAQCRIIVLRIAVLRIAILRIRRRIATIRIERTAGIGRVVSTTEALNRTGEDIDSLVFDTVFFVLAIADAPFDIDEATFVQVIASKFRLFVEADDRVPFRFARLSIARVGC